MISPRDDTRQPRAIKYLAVSGRSLFDGEADFGPRYRESFELCVCLSNVDAQKGKID